jgi:hypothetical protein
MYLAKEEKSFPKPDISSNGFSLGLVAGLHGIKLPRPFIQRCLQVALGSDDYDSTLLIYVAPRSSEPHDQFGPIRRRETTSLRSPSSQMIKTGRGRKCEWLYRE